MLLRQASLNLDRVQTFDGKGNDAALSNASVMYDDAGERAEPRAQLVGERLDAPPDILQTPMPRIVDSYAQTYDPCKILFPGLEALCSRRNLEAITLYPLCSV